jgi:hypothetical protein
MCVIILGINMINRSIFTIATVLSLIVPIFFTPMPAEKIESTAILGDGHAYLIEGVPYVEKKDSLSCDYAPIDMVLRYYGLNVTDVEICYFAGGGYSQGYQIPLKRLFNSPLRKIPYRFTCNGDLLVGGPDDYRFMANLLGLSFRAIIPEKVINHKQMWREYWDIVKNNIKNNTPVIAFLDPCAWPPYREFVNLTQPPSFFKSCCVTVVVGFNETNQTVCVNDQYAGIKKGYYRWVNLSEFKLSISRAYFELRETRYSVYLITKTSDPLPEETIYNLVHKRNIEKMKGIKSAYDGTFVTENFKIIGIDALKTLKKDFETHFRQQMPFYILFNKFSQKIDLGYTFPFKNMLRYFNDESMNHHQIAQNLLDHASLASYHEQEAYLLEMESKYWKNLTLLTGELKDLVLNSPFMVTMTQSKQTIDEMIDALDNIIVIEETIIYNN